MFRRTDGTANIVVAENITGTDNHENGRLIDNAMASSIQDCVGMQKGTLQAGRIPVRFLSDVALRIQSAETAYSGHGY
jgi:hypothetical protein